MRGSVGLAILGIALLGGCASITKGTTQQVTVNSDPQGAACNVLRDGEVITRIAKTPKTITVDKTKHDLNVVCSMEGFGETALVNQSGVEGMTAANLVFGGLIGWAVDSATGADNKYAPSITVPMKPPPGEEVIEAAPAPSAAPASQPLDPALTPGVDPSDPNYGNPDAVPQS